MPYLFLGDSPRTYPQYLDADGSGTLHAHPRETYSMIPAAGTHVLPVPPGDGRWGPETTSEPEPPAGTAEDAAEPTPARTAKSSKAAQAADQGA